MKKRVWVIGLDKKEMITAQQCINRDGSMRAVCILSAEALYQKTAMLAERGQENRPSLILLDWEIYEQDQGCLDCFQTPPLVGVPLFFMTSARSREQDERCYELGATVVIEKPIDATSLTRIERAAWQYDMTRSYESALQKQIQKLKTAREIAALNEQLENRNELLYRVFGKYFSDEVVRVILNDPQGAALGGEKKTVTVMMADLRGFTSLSEHLSAEAVIDILNHFLGGMTEIIRRRRGTVIEFVGDAILAIFGAPIAIDDSEEAALIAAIEMQNHMDEICAYCSQSGYPGIEMGIGINTGEVFIGNIGSERLMQYNVIGHAVNLCSRIESYSVGGQILMSQDAIRAIKKPVRCNQELEISMKGICNPIKIYEVLAIEADCVYEQKQRARQELQPVEDLYLMVRTLQEKRVLDGAVLRKVKAYAKDYILFVRDYSEKEPQLYQNIEIAHWQGEERDIQGETDYAYAKVVELTEEGVLARMTYLPQDFWVIQGGSKQ